MNTKISSKKIVEANQKTWDTVADAFINASALPVWGPFGIGDDLNLIPEIKGKTFLEIGCGSGRSIKYLTDNGAKKVYGLDLSSKQLEEATAHNKKEIDNGKVELIQSPMEERINIEPVDFAISVYALGWTPEPEITLKNIHSYLKPGGLFIWSWDHTIFTNIKYQDGKFVVVYSYHEENLLEVKDWTKEGATAHMTYRKTSTWFQHMRNSGFEVIAYHEPKPKDMNWGHENPLKYYSIQKASLIPCSFIFVCKKV